MFKGNQEVVCVALLALVIIGVLIYVFRKEEKMVVTPLSRKSVHQPKSEFVTANELEGKRVILRDCDQMKIDADRYCVDVCHNYYANPVKCMKYCKSCALNECLCVGGENDKFNRRHYESCFGVIQNCIAKYCPFKVPGSNPVCN